MNKDQPVFNGDWKDRELDTIWHHGVKLLAEGKIDRYQCLSLIEMEIAKLIGRIKL